MVRPLMWYVSDSGLDGIQVPGGGGRLARVIQGYSSTKVQVTYFNADNPKLESIHNAYRLIDSL